MKLLPLIPAAAACVLMLLFSATGCASQNVSSNQQSGTGGAGVAKENNSVTVAGGAYGVTDKPVAVEWEANAPACVESGGSVTPAQKIRANDGRSYLWFLAEAPAGATRTYAPSRQTDCSLASFQWRDVGSYRSRLVIDGLPAVEYVYPDFNIKKAEETMRPFHHIYDPDGSQLITKGPGGRYSHHRGIFYGYRNIRFNGKDVSSWANFGEEPDNLESTQHTRFLREWTGPVFGGHEVAIDWRDQEGNVFARETRTVRVYPRLDGELMIDVESVLSSLVGPIELDGDLQHAGLQFRAAQFVADHPQYSRYIRPEEWSDYPADEELNDTENRLDEPWNAFSFVVNGKRYTVGYFSHPRNPAGGQMSERLYGRFGEFIPGVVIDEGKPLHLRYRFLVGGGDEIDRERMEREYRAYTLTP